MKLDVDPLVSISHSPVCENPQKNLVAKTFGEVDVSPVVGVMKSHENPDTGGVTGAGVGTGAVAVA